MPKFPVPPWVKYVRWAYKYGPDVYDWIEEQLRPRLYRVEVQMFTDSLMDEDAMINIVYFTLGSGIYTAEDCAEDVGQAFASAWGSGSGQLRSAVYELRDDASSSNAGSPIASWSTNVGQAPSSLCPREVCLCLSYFAGDNLPSQRGRIFLPVPYAQVPTTAKPSATLMERAMELARQLSNIGEVDVDWSVYSRTNEVAMSITDSWCDNEWDTQRGRGLRPTARVAQTHSEA